ncbi:MAG TPA: hypothetical protein K8U80_04855 [Collinsella ihuae]|uniref:Transposase n=1 Tax=Collinsella ihumii TaxID=1720204 RepID=A0A921IPH3_9ACTN|nr:hypothetical protein [Collinsella ihumii]
MGQNPATKYTEEFRREIKGFEEPRSVYESGPTGFALCRQLRALGVDCVVGAVSRMRKPAAERRRKNDRRDAAFLARLLATRNVVEVWVCFVKSCFRKRASVFFGSRHEDFSGLGTGTPLAS